MSVLSASSQVTAASGITASSGSSQATVVAIEAPKSPMIHVQQRAALERLVSDLMISVPVVLALSLYYPVSLTRLSIYMDRLMPNVGFFR